MALVADHVEHGAFATLFSYGFRPFFLAAALWAALAMVLWSIMLSGFTPLQTHFDPVSWHAHEFLFGYLGAVMGGFLLTAVATWTGRPPVQGTLLVALFSLWLAGRISVALSAQLPPIAVAAIDLSFPIALAFIVARELVAACNWRNMIVLMLFAIFVAGNATFHQEAAAGEYAAQGLGLRIALAAVVFLIALIGGRIIPTFTRNWLTKIGAKALPPAAMQSLDTVCLLALAAGLIGWVVKPLHPLTLGILAVAGVLHLLRLARWRADLARTEPLLWILHLGYACVPLGALSIALGFFDPDFSQAAARHMWLSGAVGLMTLGVMSRACLGHTGRDLHAGTGLKAVFYALILSILARLLAGALPANSAILYLLSASCWVVAFAGFALLNWRIVWTPKIQN